MKSILSPGKDDVVYLDRAVYYYEEYIEDLLEFSKNHLVLLETILRNRSYPIGIAALVYSKGRIEVLPSVAPIDNAAGSK